MEWRHGPDRDATNDHSPVSLIGAQFASTDAEARRFAVGFAAFDKTEMPIVASLHQYME
jgi:hypothetical protein